MIIKKYPQSHLKIIGQKTKLCIDPGFYTFEINNGFPVSEFASCDAFLITHAHPDHLDPQTIKEVVGDRLVFGNQDVVSTLLKLNVLCSLVEDRKKFTIGEFEIEPFNIPHCLMADGTPGPPNTGYLINEILFHPGDGVKPVEVKSHNVALPIAGPTINFDNALNFAKSLQAKFIIPIHYSNRPVNPTEFTLKAKLAGMSVKFLSPGEEVKI